MDLRIAEDVEGAVNAGQADGPVTIGEASTPPSASMRKVSRNSNGVYPTTKRSSISLLIATAGRMRSAPMQTPTTTTRENSGAQAVAPSMIPGTPTHSKMTGALGVVTPTFSNARQACHHGGGSRLTSRRRRPRRREQRAR